VRALTPEPLRAALRGHVRALHRSKRMQVDPAIGISLVAIDGKCLGADRVKKHPSSTGMTPAPRAKGAKRSPKRAKKVSAGKENLSVPDMPAGPDGKVYLLKALRAVHVASATKPALDQLVLPDGRGEAPFLVAFVAALLQAYGRSIVECVSIDAGFFSAANLNWLTAFNVPYIAAVKGNSGALYRRLRKTMGDDGMPNPDVPWTVERVEKRNGALHRRRFMRVVEHGDGLEGDYEQVWRVCRTVEQNGQITSTEDRLFISNLPPDRLTDQQCLAAVRAHWGIENDSNWSLDVAWGEDTHTWVKMGVARETLGLLRLLAYNLVRVLRHRVLKGPVKGHIPYRELFERVRDALVSPAVALTVGGS
jgi:hypothetical protein